MLAVVGANAVPDLKGELKKIHVKGFYYYSKVHIIQFFVIFWKYRPSDCLCEQYTLCLLKKFLATIPRISCGIPVKQNFLYWTCKISRELYKKRLRSPKLTVWCVVSSIDIIGSYLFILLYFFWIRKINGSTVTVALTHYCEMLVNFFRPKMEEYGEEYNT